MSAGKHDFVIEAGTDWDPVIRLEEEDETPKDLTDYTAMMHIREVIEGPLIKELATGSGITITGAEGKIQLSLTKTETSALQITSGVYDLELTSPAPEKVTRLLEGDITVKPEITR